MAGLYLHIPFCRTRCIYCDFHSGVDMSIQERYIDALCHELDLRVNELQGTPITTIYIGGGTPSQLSIERLQRLFNHIAQYVQLNRSQEITIECNPDDLSPQYIEGLRSLPINRISMGIQSFDDNDLRFLRRRHSAQGAIDAVRRCQEAGYDNISIDLIYGLPGQTLDMWQYNIDRALSLGVQHLSAYALIYEEGTALMQLREQGRVQECNEELSLAMYTMLIERLEAAGYRQYEISNFALAHHEARHNSSYWDDTPYLGLGAAAHSYDGSSRRYNPADTQTYIDAIENGKCCYDEERLTPTDRYHDMLLTRLRTRRGINIAQCKAQFDSSLIDYMYSMAAPHIICGNMELSDGYLHITRQGLFISDSIISDLFVATD
ncbi:MAG: radical SAM family heme chaperone HemW [Bacteroidaceae bacterium]|nr:radical SAM family heme chaperone HemW [Bacteroidaceae bacterium]